MTKSDLFEFLRLHRHAVLASVSLHGTPQAALVSFVANRHLQLLFDSFDSTRKVANLRHSPRVALVIGGQVPGDERTVQYEGTVDVPAAAELEEFKRNYFAEHPDGLRRSQLPGIAYFRVTPTWIRYTDLNARASVVVELNSTSLHSGDDTTDVTVCTRPDIPVDRLWQPDMDRDRLLHSFAASQAVKPARS
jgi:general stress protein 26